MKIGVKKFTNEQTGKKHKSQWIYVFRD